MDSNFGIFVIFLVFQLFGNAFGQAGGVAIGLGLGGDFMVDTAFGELPSPFVAMATQGGAPLNQPPPPQINRLTQTGGGFNANSFSLFGSDPNFIFPLDASQIAGVSNGQTIYLPGLVGNQLHTGSSGTNRHSRKPESSNTNYILRNEDFTALGNVGHLVRVPADSASTRSTFVNFGGGGQRHTGVTLGQSGLITINPNDIIGVADLSQALPVGNGNSGIFNFNPGTGHASEITALQSGLSGTAVDMSSFLPPPFDGPPALAPPVNNQPTSVPALPAPAIDNSQVGSSSMEQSTSITNSFDTGSSTFGGSSINNNANSASFSNIPTSFNAPPKTNDIGVSTTSNTHGSMFGNNEVPANNQGADTTNYNVIGIEQTNTVDIAIDSGTVGSSTFSNLNTISNNPLVGNTGASPSAIVPRNPGLTNEQSLFEESMFNTAATHDTGLMKDPAHTGTSATDSPSASMFDMEMNLGVGASGASTLNPQSNIASSPTNTQFNEFNRAGSDNSRFGVMGSRFGSFGASNNIGRFDNSLNRPTPTVDTPSTTLHNTVLASNTPVTSVNETHVNDLSSEGLYPFEGNMNAMDASIAEGRAAIVDMNTALVGHEPLHIEPTVGVPSSPPSQGIGPAVNTIGMFNVSNRNIEVSSSNVDYLSYITAANQTNNMDVAVNDSQVLIDGKRDNLLKDKIDSYIGSETNLNLKQDNSFRGELNGLNVNTSTNMFVNLNNYSNNNNQSKHVIGMLSVNGTTINNNFAVSNNLVSNNNNNTYTITNKTINAAIVDMVDSSSVSGLGSGQITNLVGLEANKANTGGMAVSDFSSQMYEFRTVPDNSASSNNPTMSSSVIGAGQLDSSVIRQETIAPVNTMQVGGTALGSQSFDFGGISLPDKAFVSNKDISKPTQSEIQSPVKVDMTNFIPPPFMSEEFGAPSNAIPDVNTRNDHLNQKPKRFHQDIVNAPLKQETIPEPSLPTVVREPMVNSQSMSTITDEFRSINAPHQGHHAQPVVGSIFGTTDISNSTFLTKKLLEKSGMTREPDVDFMTSFLNNAKPSRTLNRGNEHLQIVPFGSDISKIGTQSNNMIIVGRSEANNVDQFGVADIYTRQQQLNPSQWKQLMKKVSQDANPAPVNNPRPFYQTQNLIGASETKPLTGSLTRSTITRNSPPSPQAITRPAIGTGRSTGEFTMFAAPGMTGRKSVTIPNFGSFNQQTSFSVQAKPASTASMGFGSQQQLNEFANPQTGLRTNTDVSSNNFNQRRRGDIQNTLGRGSFSTVTSDSVRSNTNQMNAQPQPAQFGPTGGQSTSDTSTFTLGQSILVADGSGNIPDLTRRNQNTQGIQFSPNVQTLGQPATSSGANTLSSHQTQRLQPGGHSVMSQFSNQGSLSLSRAGTNPGMSLSPPASSTLTVNRTVDFSVDANMNMRPLVPGMSQSGHMSQMSGSGTNAVKQPMSPTLFTSGNRLAVFGPANDVSGRLINARQAKPVPAMRVGVLAPVVDCRYSPDPTSEYYFIYKNGLTQHRFRCALGTAFDEMTCECSIRVSDHGDCLEVHMDFNEGVVADSSLNRLPIGNENVEVTNSTSPIPGIALFGGDSKLTIWRYQNYDFRDHVMLKVQFRAGVGGQRYQPLISNCDGGVEGPSMAIVYDNLEQLVMLILKTDNDTRKQLTFSVNPDEWNDVTYIYDGQEFIGIVNGVRRYVSKENPHLLGLIGGVIKSSPTQGLVEIRDAAIVLGHCPMYGYFRGAMVDIQIYTCIPKDFRLE